MLSKALNQKLRAPRPRTKSDKSDEESEDSMSPLRVKRATKVTRKSMFARKSADSAPGLKGKAKGTADLQEAVDSNNVVKFPGIEEAERISVVAEKDTKGDDREATYRLRLFEHICMGLEKRSVYDENVGPVKPGYFFYKWLLYGPPLRMPIPDTLLINGQEIRRLRNDANGYIVRERFHYANDQAARDDFVVSCINSFVVDSRPFGSSPALASLKGRFVALIKKPITFGHALVSNSIECLTPHALQASVLETLDTRGNGSDYVLQKFIKGKGAKPSVYRVMWRSGGLELRRSQTTPWEFLEMDPERSGKSCWEYMQTKKEKKR